MHRNSSCTLKMLGTRHLYCESVAVTIRWDVGRDIMSIIRSARVLERRLLVASVIHGVYNASLALGRRYLNDSFVGSKDWCSYGPRCAISML